jgi:hypothetical protein
MEYCEVGDLSYHIKRKIKNNEYWVSFYIDKVIHDKKFIFLPGTINEEFFTSVPIIFKKGVMIR